MRPAIGGWVEKRLLTSAARKGLAIIMCAAFCSLGSGGSGARWVPVRSKREKVRTWASLTAVGRFADGVGLRGFTVEL